MNSRTHRIKIAALLLCLASLCVALGGRAVGAREGNDGSDQERRGKAIYFKGEDVAGPEITAVMSGLEMPATAFTCANCHGASGAGTKEGGLQPPPVDWASLTTPYGPPLTSRTRPAYTEATAARAILSGLDPSGVALHPGMPRYRMTLEQAAALVAYLKKIGGEADADPGLGDATIRVGAALPLTGALAQTGESVKASLTAYFLEVNARGGIYGRSFELVVEDSGAGAAAGLEATRRLVERDRVFALVGSFGPAGGPAVQEFLLRAEVPLIGPLTTTPPQADPPNRFVFYFLPTFGEQARTLADFAAAKSAGTPAGVAVVSADGPNERDALAGLKAQAGLHSLEVVAEYVYGAGRFSPAEAARVISERRPKYLFFFGGQQDFDSLARELDRLGLDVPVLTSAVMVGRGAFGLRPGAAARTYLAYPAALPGSDDLTEFLTMTRKAGVPLQSPAFQTVAFAAAKTLVEATKLSGRKLSRAVLINSLERLQDYRTGAAPPLTFGQNRRVGAAGSYVVGIDLKGEQFVPLTSRLEPRKAR